MSPRSIWKGAISFGLVTIPVALYSAEDRGQDIDFHMLDKKTMSRVKQKRVNEETGNEVAWDDIVKGYEYEDGRFVVLTPEEIKAANPKASGTIDIVAVVGRECIEPTFYNKPYYVGPDKAGRKPYALLREVLRREDRVAVAKVVIRTKQYLAALIPEGDVLLLDLLRYAYELRKPSEIDVPGSDLSELGISEKEVELAKQLVDAMAAKWEPEQYVDTYHNDLLGLIKMKAEAGGGPIELPEAEAPPAKVIDIMSLLKKSVEAAEKDRGSGAKEAADTAERADKARKKSPAKKDEAAAPKAKSRKRA